MGVLPSAIFFLCAGLSVVVYAFALEFLYSVSEVKALTVAQYGVAVCYGLVLGMYCGAEAAHAVARMQPQEIAEDEQDLVSDGEKTEATAIAAVDPCVCGVKRSHLGALRKAAEFVLIMGFVYLCDRTTLVGKGPKYVDSTAFWAVCGAILLLALLTVRGGGPTASEPVDAYVKPLQRDQTEEWKGWMQIMFVLYHYFAQADIYNAIRMYIAAYVWMTGFGNFSYYYVKQDFTAVRFAQMMWRLNFFVLFVCATMNNEYMLYYICPMHTFFTWGVFIPLFLCNHLNGSFKVLFVKIVATLAAAALLYDVPGVFDTLMYPLRSILAFHDPLHPENSPMHEWYFRSGLDHFVWVFGMFCAFSFPYLDEKLALMEGLESRRRTPVRLALLGVTLALGAFWYFSYFSLPKRSYNQVHPYTSFLPIFLYLVLRNLHEALRRRHMHLFAWCGKITLETYILQFHCWMRTTGVNGSPKYLMVWFPGSYWLNFVVVSAVYVFLSFRVFHITAALRDYVIPKEGGAALAKRSVAITAVAPCFYAVGYGLKMFCGTP